MKNRIIFLLASLLVSIVGYAQMDDMYFVPTKEKKASVEKKRVQNIPSQTVTDVPSEAEDADVVYATGTLRDVDEYNRRDLWHNDSILEETEYEDSMAVDEEMDLNDDYHYSKRILRFCAPSIGVMVSSPLYWDLCYGPNSIYWDVYVDGIYAYAFPSSWSSLYWGPYFSFSWGWGPYWGWGGPWYAGWYRPWYGPHWHYPHWGHGGHFVASRPVVRPSVRYRETRSLTGRNYANGRRPALRSDRLSTRNSNSFVRNRGASGTRFTPRRSSTTSGANRTQRSTYTLRRTQPSRSSGFSPSTRSSSTPSFRAPVRSGGGGFTPSRSGGVSRGRR